MTGTEKIFLKHTLISVDIAAGRARQYEKIFGTFRFWKFQRFFHIALLSLLQIQINATLKSQYETIFWTP